MKLRELVRMALENPDSLIGREVHPLALLGWLRSKLVRKHYYFEPPNMPAACWHVLVIEWKGRRIVVELSHPNPYTFHGWDPPFTIIGVTVRQDR